MVKYLKRESLLKCPAAAASAAAADVEVDTHVGLHVERCILLLPLLGAVKPQAKGYAQAEASTMPSCDRNRSKVLVLRYLVKISEVLSCDDTRARERDPSSTKSWMNSSLMEMCLVSLPTPRREARAVAEVESVANSILSCEAGMISFNKESTNMPSLAPSVIAVNSLSHDERLIAC